jgi:hypothetical protein
MPYKEAMRPTHLSLLVVAAAACRPSALEAPVQDSTPPVVPASEDTDAPIPADSPDEAPAPDLLLNGSFETEDAWAVWGGAERVEAHATDGTWSLRATRENGAEQLVTGLLPNAIYRLSGWGRTEGDEPMLIGVKDHGRQPLSPAPLPAAQPRTREQRRPGRRAGLSYALHHRLRAAVPVARRGRGHGHAHHAPGPEHVVRRSPVHVAAAGAAVVVAVGAVTARAVTTSLMMGEPRSGRRR